MFAQSDGGTPDNRRAPNVEKRDIATQCPAEPININGGVGKGDAEHMNMMCALESKSKDGKESRDKLAEVDRDN